MHKFKVHLISLLACSFVPAFISLIFILLMGVFSHQLANNLGNFISMFLLAFIISAIHALVLGFPLYLLVKKYFNFTYFFAGIIGFIVGALPLAVFTWPLRYAGTRSSSSFNGVQHMIEGVPTMAGWLSYIQGFMVFGCLGILGAITYNYLLKKQKL